MADGKFLIRKYGQKKDEYALCVVYRGKPTHHLIKKVCVASPRRPRATHTLPRGRRWLLPRQRSHSATGHVWRSAPARPPTPGTPCLHQKGSSARKSLALAGRRLHVCTLAGAMTLPRKWLCVCGVLEWIHHSPFRSSGGTRYLRTSDTACSRNNARCFLQNEDGLFTVNKKRCVPSRSAKYNIARVEFLHQRGPHYCRVPATLADLSVPAFGGVGSCSVPPPGQCSLSHVCARASSPHLVFLLLSHPPFSRVPPFFFVAPPLPAAMDPRIRWKASSATWEQSSRDGRWHLTSRSATAREGAPSGAVAPKAKCLCTM